ncbi:uncharacterized protein LOC131632665 [Vicia villosa]|uniref:uncharacterized protein LOC131632665 n=1 Tax=Vicia villosa TaxID=3911 RepID=UPI00273B4D1E|nr:uncharacterized protein LOC131632665 [Vicia villosa]
MDSTTTIVGRGSILEPPYFDGENCSEWKERMKIFIQSVDFKLWLVIKNGTKIEKSEDEYNDEDMKMMEQEAKAKHILFCALNPEDRKRVSCCNKAKEMWDELDKSSVNSTAVVSEIETDASAAELNNTPNLEFLKETSDDPKKNFLNLCVPIYKHAIKGNWPAAKRMIDKENKLKNAAITQGWHTLLHVAVGSNKTEFVKQLLKILDDNDLDLQDKHGITAFCFAVSAGNIEIVNLMLKRNSQLPIIRDQKGFTPIQYAAFIGKYKLTWHLYDKTIHSFEEKDWNVLFFGCFHTGIYDIALKMVRDKNTLAFARDTNQCTALHWLATNQMHLNSSCHGQEHDDNPIMTNPYRENQVYFQFVKFLWTAILDKYYYSEAELRKIINEPFQLIFYAARVGNYGFISELISCFASPC